MNIEIHEIVCRVYATSLSLPDEWSAAQRAEFLETEATRMTYRVDDLWDHMASHAINEWRRTHDGEFPDFFTKVGMINNSRLQAMEVVLSNELYELIPEEEEQPSTLWGEDQPIPDRSQTPWDQRWVIPELRTEPSETIEDLIDQMWPKPEYSSYFRIKAGYLLAARDEDAMALPHDPQEPLAQELAQMVYGDLRADGWPEEYWVGLTAPAAAHPPGKERS